jgi:hypothetical protein
MSIVIINNSRSVHLMKKWQTGGNLQGVMRQVVGCGVVNVMVGLSVYKLSVYKFAYCISNACPTLYHQLCALLIPNNSRCDEIW